jgi:uncharacterized Fe-S cluster-containing radical SAM superfamily protein
MRGAQAAVPPMTMEWAPVLACDADCPLCPFRRSRLKLEQGTVTPGKIASSDDKHAASLETAHRVLEAAYEGGVRGVLFTGGGEPLVWEHLLDALKYSSDLSMDNCMYTNGFRLGDEGSLAHSLLSPQNHLVFVRVSVNAMSRGVVRKHWGLDVIEVDRQIEGLAALLHARNNLVGEYEAAGRSVPSIQISTIIDRQNVEDLPAICDTVARVFRAVRVVRGVEDVMVVRPLTIHGRPNGYSTHDHDDSVVRGIVSECGAGGRGANVLAAAGLAVYLGFGLSEVEGGQVPTYSALVEREYASRDVSWSNGLFLTVGPDGTVYPTTERNCDEKWAIGSLLDQSVRDIYSSDRRQSILAMLNSEHWGPSVAQPTSRTARLDRIARALMSGGLGSAEIAEVQQRALRQHQVILD